MGKGRLRDLSADDLADFAAHTMTTVGGPRDFLHFFPRLFELSLLGEPHVRLEPEALASNLDSAKWGKLSAEEQDAIASAFRAAGRELLAHPPRYLPGSDASPVKWSTFEAMEALQRLLPEGLGPFLETWPLDRTMPLLHVAVLAEDLPRLGEPLRCWLLRRETAAALEAALQER